MPRFCIKIGHDYFLFPPLSPHLDGTTDQVAVAIETERSDGLRCKADEVTGGQRKLLKLQSYGDAGLTDKVASGFKAFERYLGGAYFEYQRGHRISWLK